MCIFLVFWLTLTSFFRSIFVRERIGTALEVEGSISTAWRTNIFYTNTMNFGWTCIVHREPLFGLVTSFFLLRFGYTRFGT